jgi:hypothetical protein
VPTYSFEIRWNRGEKNSWSYLPSDDVACEVGRLLARNFKESDQYPGSANLIVKDSKGMAIAFIEF